MKKSQSKFERDIICTRFIVSIGFYLYMDERINYVDMSKYLIG